MPRNDLCTKLGNEHHPTEGPSSPRLGGSLHHVFLWWEDSLRLRVGKRLSASGQVPGGSIPWSVRGCKIPGKGWVLPARPPGRPKPRVFLRLLLTLREAGKKVALSLRGFPTTQAHSPHGSYSWPYSGPEAIGLPPPRLGRK